MNLEIKFFFFKSSKIKLQDGTSFKADKRTLSLLNDVLNNTNNPTKFVKDITKNKQEFNKFINFATNLNEDFDLLDERSVWQGFKNGAYNGTKIGTIGGGLAGMATGAAIGGSVGAASDLGKFINKAKPFKKIKDSYNKANDYAFAKSQGLNSKVYMATQNDKRKPVTNITTKEKINSKDKGSKTLKYAWSGAKEGSKIGATIGAATGAAYGGAIGGGVQLAKNTFDAAKYAMTGRLPKSNYTGGSIFNGEKRKAGRPRTKPPKPTRYYQYPDGTKIRAGRGPTPSGVKVINVIEEDIDYNQFTILGTASPGLDSDPNIMSKNILKKIKNKKNINNKQEDKK